MPNPMMAMMFAMRNAVPFSVVQSLAERATAPMQLALKVGDTGFQLRDEGFYDDQLTIVKILDPTDVVPDWAERVERGYLYCEWHTAEDPDGERGWFARIFTLPIPETTYDNILVHLHEHEDELEAYFDSDKYFPELDRIYRDFSAQMAELEERISPARCEACFSYQVEVNMDHISHIKGSAVWHTLDDGSVKLAPTSKISNCENVATITCLDCGWNRALESEELLTSHS